MKNIKKNIVIFLLICTFTFINSVEARQGCCSHHGGVCGCGCCDGSALSSTCAPYYPSCQSSKSYTKDEDNKEENEEDNNWIWWLGAISMGGAGYWVYSIRQNKKDNKKQK